VPTHTIAHPDSTSPLTTTLIQAALDRAGAAGGGTVVLEGGHRYVCGTLLMHSNVELHLEAGAVLVGSPRKEDYQEVTFGGEYGGKSGAFILTAHNATNIAVTGPGTIDGDSLQWMDGWMDPTHRYIRKPKDWRPRGIGFYHCTGIRIESLVIRDMPQWTIHLTACSDVLCQGLSILNRLDVPNCDGIDADRRTAERQRNARNDAPHTDPEYPLPRRKRYRHPRQRSDPHPRCGPRGH
jgi:polygalacturonase